MNLRNINSRNMGRRSYRYFMCASVLVFTYYFLGVGDYIHTRSFKYDFDYPLNIDIRPLVQNIVKGKNIDIEPINFYPYRFLTNSGICDTSDKLDLLIAVKSAMSNFGHRHAIRQTYGQKNLVPGRIVRLLFFLGIDGSPKSETQMRIDEEMAYHKDIIQIDFHDNYYNNTIKTMMSFRWMYEHCSNADYYLFTDDDMYISVNNLLEYAIKAPGTTEEGSKSPEEIKSKKEQDKHLFAGYVFESTPQRFRNSKWRVSLEEYPWDRWPAYVTAGAYVVSNRSMTALYVGSLFVKHFRFDDIYLGIVAKKVGIAPTHCPNFHFYKKNYTKKGYRDVIASHGFGDHDELIRVWNEQNNMRLISNR